MSLEYRINILDQTGLVTKETLDEFDELSSLGEFSIDRGGSCGDGSFDLLPSAVDIALRDIVLVSISVNGGAFTPIYRGMIVELPNAQSDNLGRVRCVGLKQRFYETTTVQVRVNSADVAAMFTAVMNENLSASFRFPAAVTFTSADAPTLTFQTGDIYPKYQSLGDFADNLAALVGSFIVPAATTYTYDSVTFNAGDLVPAVVWGVDADGKLFFRRPVGAAVAFSESSDDTDVEWLSVEAEELVNRVNVIYGSAFDLDLYDRVTLAPTAGTGEVFLPDPLPIIRTFSAAGVTNRTAAILTVAAPDPLAIMSQTAQLGLDPGSITWTNLVNAVDNDVVTFAASTGPTGITIGQVSIGVLPDVLLGAGFGQGILKIVYSSTADVNFELSLAQTVFFGDIIFTGVLPSTNDLDLISTVGLLVAMPKEVGLEQAIPYPLTSSLVLFTDGDIRLRSVQAFRPDVDSGAVRDRHFAESYFTQPKLAVANVKVNGIQPVAPRLTITPTVGAAVTAPVERVGYSITSQQGYQTVYYVDHEFTAEEQAQRTLLERLAVNAVDNNPASSLDAQTRTRFQAVIL
jgi:hypothetical protein